MELVLAPIHGLTYANYRNSYDEIFGGIDTYYTPFISTTGLRIDDSVIFDDVKPKFNNKNLKIVPQLLGNNGVDFSYFGNRIAEFGYSEINWNLGCPQRNITKKMKGSGLLANPSLIEEILDKIFMDKQYNLTVKIRLGMKQIEEGIEVINLLNKYPLKGVIIHPRTAKQMYGGHVDLDAFETLYGMCQHEVTYNGDIFTKEDFSYIQQRFPNVNKVMIGRGALKNPFLPMSIKGIELNEEQKLNKILNFHDRIYNNYQSTALTNIRVIGKMKEFWPYLAWFFDPSGGLMSKIRLTQSCSDYDKVISELKSNIN